MIDCQRFGDGTLERLNVWAKLHKVPLYTTFELTPFCNFRCVMCYIRLEKNQAEKQGRMLTADEWLEIAKQAKQMGALHLSLTGGEPLTHPQFWEIYKELNKMGFLVSILSNGSLIDEEAMENFKRYGMPHMIKLTAYGASDETYKKTCGSEDGFTRLSKAVDLLREAGVPVTMTSTIVRENADDLQEIYRFAASKGVKMRHTITVMKSSRGAVNTAETSRFAFADFPDEVSLEDLEASKFPPLDSPFAWCASYLSTMWVTWNGKLQLCSSLTNPNIRYSDDLKKDFARLNEELGKVKSPDECKDCEWAEFCQRCPGALCAESGHPEKISKDFCRMAGRLLELYNIKKKEI